MPTENENKYVLTHGFNETGLVGWTRQQIEQGYFRCPIQIYADAGDYIFEVVMELPGLGRSTIVSKVIDDRDYAALLPRAGEHGIWTGGARARRCDDAHIFTYKTWSDEQGRLVEIEEHLTPRVYQAVAETCHSRVAKNRYHKIVGAEDWVVDFLKRDDGTTYFVLSEVEMAEAKTEPNLIPEEILGSILYCVPRQDDRFSNRMLADVTHALTMYDEMGVQP